MKKSFYKEELMYKKPEVKKVNPTETIKAKLFGPLIKKYKEVEEKLLRARIDVADYKWFLTRG